MPIDFTQIESGEKFELLCEDLLLALSFTIEAKVARGPDLGRDIIASKTVIDDVGIADTHRYLVECKHYAKSGKSVLERDIGSPIARMGTHKCDRYLLVTSTVPSEKVRAQLTGMPNIAPNCKATAWSEGDLTRLLDAHPDVRARHFPPEPEPEPTPAGALAATVESLLACKGYVCQSREAKAERVRLVCTQKDDFAFRVLVVCKEGTIGRRDVEGLVAEVEAQGLTGGLLVTHLRVSPAARERAAETAGTVRVLTRSEFYTWVIDFEPYVRSLITDYDQSELATYYVDLGCRTGDGSEIKPMDGYVDDWLRDPTRNHISILGDYGTGKTSFCRQYAAELSRRWLADPDGNRIPILITLRDYAKAMNLEQLITDFLVNRYGIQAPYDAFARFNADGKLVLLFDGFDEMAQKVDYQTTVDNFEELARAVEERSKVVLTCRTPYFRTREEAEELLHAWPAGVWEGAEDAAELPERPAIDLSGRPNFEIVHLLPFDDGDVRAILQKRAPGEWEDYWEQIQETYNLPELAQRPVLLDMIVCSFPQLEPGQAINAARLYELYTDLWLTRDWEKGRTLITRDDKRLFMQQLALEMHRRQELSIHYSGLSGRVREHFRLEKADEIDYFDSDVRTCSFLNRDPEGNYQFVHKSFGEFFVAQWLAPRLLDATAPEMLINEEIRGFVHGLLEGADWPPPPPEGVEVPEGMVWVPEGPFIMGGEGSDEGGTRVVRLDHGFFVARTPVTNAGYARFVEATGHVTVAEKEGGMSAEVGYFVKGFDWRHPEGPGSSIADRMDHPVVQVTRDDAVAYAEWAGGQLPAEEEWEKAARGIDGRIFPWGDGFDPARCNSSENGIDTTTRVGHYSPQGDSPCGCADAAGNVWEWTASESEPWSADGVLRGGAFLDNGEGLVRCAYRGWVDPVIRVRYVGFRMCVVAQQD
jgi:formylglycine-generating enzyme required for sulfatase activity